MLPELDDLTVGMLSILVCLYILMIFIICGSQASRKHSRCTADLHSSLFSGVDAAAPPSIAASCSVTFLIVLED